MKETDKRLEANRLVKLRIARALTKLMEKKNFSDITVTEIVQTAGVARASYYRNFTSKEEVIEFKLDKLMTDWIEHEKTIRNTSACELAIRFFQFFYSIRDIVQTLIQAKLSLLLLNALIIRFGDVFTQDCAEYYRQIFISFGLCGVILTWMDTGMNESPEEMGKIVTETFFPQEQP